MCVSNSSMSALCAFLRSVAIAASHVRVTNIAAGLVETNFSKVRFKGDEEKARAVYSNVAMGGPLSAEDVADCILFAVTRRPNVNIDEIVVMALAQTSGANVMRE